MVQTDSIDKIVTRYFAIVTNEPFTWKGKKYHPKPLQVSPQLLRGFTCPKDCAACCPRFSLDYLPSDPDGGQLIFSTDNPLSPRYSSFNGRRFLVYSDLQDDNNSHHCRNVKVNGRCGIYSYRPFSCDFELIRPLIFKDPERPNVLTQKLFGRGWNMKRIDGKRGTLCQMILPTPSTVVAVIRKLMRLDNWCQHFGLSDNKCQSVIDWVERIDPFLYTDSFYQKISPKLIK